MGLQQRAKRNRIRFGISELIAFTLAGIAGIGVLVWLSSPSDQGWKSTEVYITGIEPLSSNDGKWAVINFSYMVDGTMYTGTTYLTKYHKLLYVALNPALREIMRSRGIESIDDLPGEIQEVLEKKGIRNMQEVPEQVVTSLHDQGYNTLADAPDELRSALLERDYGAAARFIDKTLPDAGGRTVTATTQNAVPASTFLSSVIQQYSPTSLRVNYNPLYPHQYKLSLLPPAIRFGFLLIAILSAIAAVLYCLFLYPTLRAMRP